PEPRPGRRRGGAARPGGRGGGAGGAEAGVVRAAARALRAGSMRERQDEKKPRRTRGTRRRGKVVPVAPAASAGLMDSSSPPVRADAGAAGRVEQRSDPDFLRVLRVLRGFSPFGTPARHHLL